MLLIGLTGGIGAGKSTVARVLEQAGAAIVDADAIAREVVAPGAPALQELVTAFGPDILTPEGALDRPGLAAVAFADRASTQRLNAIMHPAIAELTAERFRAHTDRELVVHDVPLLVENGMSARYHLALLVDVPAEVRLERLIDSRGMDRADAERRIAAQASDAQRHRACDVVIDNAGEQAATAAAVERLVHERLLPFSRNLAAGLPASREQAATDGAPEGPRERAWAAERLTARIRHACAEAGVEIDSVERTDDAAAGAIALTAVPGAGESEERFGAALGAAGFPPVPAGAADTPGQQSARSLHRSADPGRPADVELSRATR